METLSLRPSATVYDLARKYDLEVSMFERLIKMNLPYVRLNSQGLKTDLFFLEHNYPEENMRDGKSRQNQHEAMFVVALCRYLLLQDYEPEQITILTTYTAQLLCLGRLMKTEKSFARVRVHTVDKYQWEENDIILLSLVRSNAEGKVGFLRISNRVCVALSRARKALYCICNSEMLGRVELWAGIFGTLREKGEIGTALPLCCRNHPDREVEASCAKDFEPGPDGGCKLRCEFSLECGHPCALYCHPRDPEHKKYQCPEKCARFLCDLKHGCPLRCHEPCPECMVMVEKTIPECQHKQMVPCHQDPETISCWEPCQKKLQCGHNQMVPCHQDPETLACQEPCQEMLKCGHACTGTCHSCHQGRYHFSCAQRCERLLICSHKCQEICAPDCSACRRPCENRCVHGNCTHPCGHPCTPCTEPCAWQCPHQRCSKRCHEPCDRPPCVQPCDKILECGHPCIGLCGEKCPKRCRICDANVFGTEDADRTALYVRNIRCNLVKEGATPGPFTEQDQVKQALKCLEDMIHERKAIVPAIQMTPGHWYRCPKGHVYVMSEGEGATESERCPDCDTELKKKCRLMLGLKPARNTLNQFKQFDIPIHR